jgi:hypothetical protein
LMRPRPPRRDRILTYVSRREDKEARCEAIAFGRVGYLIGDVLSIEKFPATSVSNRVAFLCSQIT